MYAGNTVPTEWPQRADKSTYERYAKLPALHVEEAASLAAGLVPRQGFALNFRPIHDEPAKPKPYEGVKTWGILLDETQAVGRVISLLAQARGARGVVSDLPITPIEFLEFCDRYGVDVPPELRSAIQQSAASNAISPAGHGAQPGEGPAPSPGVPFAPSAPRVLNRDIPAVPKQPEARYRSGALQVVRELKDAGAYPVPAAAFKAFIESHFAPPTRTVTHRVFQDYLRKWRRAGTANDELKALLADILPESGGRPRDEDAKELKKRLPAKYACVKWRTPTPREQTTTTTRTP